MIFWILNTLIILLSLLLSWSLYQDHYLIPQSIIQFSKVEVRTSDFYTILWVALPLSALVFGFYSWKHRHYTLWSIRRAVDDTFTGVLVMSLTSVLVFVATITHFSPNFFVWAMALVAAIHLLWVLVTQLASPFVLTNEYAVNAPWLILRRIFTPLGILTLVIALSPGGLALLYKKDRAFANQVNSFKRLLTQSHQARYNFVNAFGDMSFEQAMEVEFEKERRGYTPYVLERGGRVYRITKNSKQLVLDFSDLVGRVRVENGALGMELHPEFGFESSPNFGRAFFVFTTQRDKKLYHRLSEFNLKRGDSEDNLNTRRDLFKLERNRAGYHNGGAVEFGPDGFLYIGMGEANDKKGHQNIKRSLFSGILRIDVEDSFNPASAAIQNQPYRGETQNYKIPKSNPFVGVPGAMEEFFAIGLRNPFRINFDPHTEKLWVGDVGNMHFEEVNIAFNGSNHLYPYVEGPKTFKDKKIEHGKKAPPYFYYPHTALDRAIIGGAVYRGSKFESLYGHYLFGDNYSGRVLAIPAQGAKVGETKPVFVGNSPHLGQMGLTSVSVSPAGDILATTLGKAGAGNGLVLKLKAENPSGMNHGLVAAGERAPEVSEFANADPKSVYQNNCARCHGVAGRGDGEATRETGLKVANFLDPQWQRSVSDKDIFKAIRDGGSAVGKNAGMPAWGAMLNEKQIRALVELIRSKEFFKKSSSN